MAIVTGNRVENSERDMVGILFRKGYLKVCERVGENAVCHCV